MPLLRRTSITHTATSNPTPFKGKLHCWCLSRSGAHSVWNYPDVTSGEQKYSQQRRQASCSIPSAESRQRERKTHQDQSEDVT
ncbi:hypothetical protein MUG91_G3n147 [Manis pentadactyla]|nr:hypothetical protein MUG91_G3n147 [Manis pentadactyla]